MWCADGSALHDRIDDLGFTLLKLGDTVIDTAQLEDAFRKVDAPLAVHELEEPELRDVYGADLLLLRPDLHVAWRSDALPGDPVGLAVTVTGAAPGR